MITQPSVENRVEAAVDHLADEFRGVFGRETIQSDAHDTLRLYRESNVMEFVPLFVYRFTRERLRAAGQVEGKLTKLVPEVLFVCVHNAGRSQIAAALTQSMSRGRVHVRSAGSTPASDINPAVVEAMAEIGLDMSQEFPKPLTNEVVEAADVVVTMGCGDACPIYAGKRYEDWDLPDPAGASIHEVRVIRADIELRVSALLASLGIAVEQSAESHA
jgi:protein-tyrosine-phosphatase